MKIAFVVFSLSNQSGGTTTALLHLYESLADKAEITIYAAHKAHETLHAAFENKPNVHVFEGKSAWWYAPSLGKALARDIEKFDLIHIHSIWSYPSFIGAKLAQRHRKPYIISPHGMLEGFAFRSKRWKKMPYWWLIQNRQLRKANSIHGISLLEMQNIAKMFPQTAVTQIPNGIEVPHDNAYQLRTPKIIGFMGRIHPIKGLDRLIQAFSTLPNSGDEWQLQIAGSGDAAYENTIQQLIADSPRQAQITMLGAVRGAEKTAFYDRISFLAVASHSEVLSLVALEAMRAGVPCLVTRQCSFDEIETHEAGIVVENNEIETLRSGLIQLQNSDLSAMSRRAHHLVRTHYSLDTIAERYLAYYHQVSD